MQSLEHFQFRHTLTLPFFESMDYSVEDVFNFIVKEMFQFDLDRKRHKIYLLERLHKSIQNNEFELWNSSFDKVKDDLSKYKDPSPIINLQWWALNANINGTDLVKFCKKEKIHIVFEEKRVYPSSNQSLNDLSLGEPTPFATWSKYSCIPENKHELTGKASKQTEAKFSEGQKRYDVLAAEMEPFLLNDPSLTATELMVILLGKIDAPGTCILRANGSGLDWEPFGGAPRILTLKRLEDRIQRWKKKNKTTP